MELEPPWTLGPESRIDPPTVCTLGASLSTQFGEHRTLQPRRGDRVLERVRNLCFVSSHESFPLLPMKRKLQQLNQHCSVPSSVCRLPLFQKTSPDLKSIRWINQFRDHLECSIFCVHR